ncbi:hypothetical protein C8R43DRAFT_1115711 [Mycena crocata]|nr:hypothetical protein C8R43DRAFT_1115711 [Mycena crocata]
MIDVPPSDTRVCEENPPHIFEIDAIFPDAAPEWNAGITVSISMEGAYVACVGGELASSSLKFISKNILRFTGAVGQSRYPEFGLCNEYITLLQSRKAFMQHQMAARRPRRAVNFEPSQGIVTQSDVHIQHTLRRRSRTQNCTPRWSGRTTGWQHVPGNVRTGYAAEDLLKKSRNSQKYSSVPSALASRRENGGAKYRQHLLRYLRSTPNQKTSAEHGHPPGDILEFALIGGEFSCDRDSQQNSEMRWRCLLDMSDKTQQHGASVGYGRKVTTVRIRRSVDPTRSNGKICILLLRLHRLRARSKGLIIRGVWRCRRDTRLEVADLVARGNNVASLFRMIQAALEQARD